MKRISLTDDIMMPALQALMETTWLYAAILLISAKNANGIPYAGFLQIFSLFTAAAWVTRISQLIPHQIWNRILLLPVVLIILLVWFYWIWSPGMNFSSDTWTEVLTELWNTSLEPSVFFIWLIVIYITGRGVWMGFSHPDSKTHTRWFLVGTAFFVFLFALWPNVRQTHPFIGKLWILVSVYFLVGLGLLSFINLQRLGKISGGRGNFSFSWLLAISIPIILVILLGLIFTGGFSAALHWLLMICLQFAGAIGSFFLWLGTWLLSWLSGSVSPPRGPQYSTPYKIPEYGGEWEFLKWRFFNIENLSGTEKTIYVSVAFLVIATLAVIVSLMFRRRTYRESPMLDVEERTSLWSWALAWNQIKKILLRVVRRLRYGLTKVDHSIPARSIGPSEEVTPVEIRMIYRRFLEWAAAHKRPRHPAQTPLEHINVISDQTTTVSLHTIAECYHDVRYGEITATPVDVERARHALRVLEEIEDIDHTLLFDE